jgi:hypothetical protein
MSTPNTVRRDSIPSHLEGQAWVIYSTPRRLSRHLTDLLLACWHTDRWPVDKSRSIYVLRNDEDWCLFKIANAIMDAQPVVIKW